MIKRHPMSALAVILIGGVLGYGAASRERPTPEKPTITPVLSETKAAATATPEFVIDDCCVFPGLTREDILSAMPRQNAQEEMGSKSR